MTGEESSEVKGRVHGPTTHRCESQGQNSGIKANRAKAPATIKVAGVMSQVPEECGWMRPRVSSASFAREEIGFRWPGRKIELFCTKSSSPLALESNLGCSVYSG